jgi:hypothetical protein
VAETCLASFEALNSNTSITEKNKGGGGRRDRETDRQREYSYYLLPECGLKKRFLKLSVSEVQSRV